MIVSQSIEIIGEPGRSILAMLRDWIRRFMTKSFRSMEKIRGKRESRLRASSPPRVISNSLVDQLWQTHACVNWKDMTITLPYVWGSTQPVLEMTLPLSALDKDGTPEVFRQ